ncbi:MAG TPA: OmpH family outer membrane protein [Pyrinomonadaceae bacterium]|jgi:Skp family chaperone for outer membrane proteins
MRIIRLFAATLFIAAIAAIPAFAQQRGGAQQPAATAPAQPQQSTGPVPASKIAFVNTQAFADDKIGIARYVAALKNLDREFQPRVTEMQNMANRLKTLNDDIQKLSSNPAVVDEKTINAKREEGEGLQRDLEYKKKQYDAAVGKRYEEVVGPISNDIGNALTTYAKAHGITMILDASKLLEAIITVDPNMDITSEFISEYNSKNPATASTAAPGR